jgi:hypothetical protein
MFRALSPALAWIKAGAREEITPAVRLCVFGKPAMGPVINCAIYDGGLKIRDLDIN